MLEMQGEAGRTGDSAHLQSVDWADHGIQGRGEFRISKRGGSSGEALEWQLEAPTKSDGPGDNGWHYRSKSPAKGGSAAAIPKPRSAQFVENDYDAHREESDRLAGPIQFVLKLLEFWRLEADQAVGLLGFDLSDTDHVAAVLAGREQLRGRDVRDRISHLFWIRRTLWSLFRDINTENDWLREPHSMLDDRSPLSLLVGSSMEDLLLAREYVDAVAGR